MKSFLIASVFEFFPRGVKVVAKLSKYSHGSTLYLWCHCNVKEEDIVNIDSILFSNGESSIGKYTRVSLNTSFTELTHLTSIGTKVGIWVQ